MRLVYPGLLIIISLVYLIMKRKKKEKPIVISLLWVSLVLSIIYFLLELFLIFYE
jgi:hypothetical protein